ncbi:MAG: DUF4159 domain-containing protein [Myxococcota bacterium]|nr:DUF4159 domain-containing protein [Myxococcota bacterium]
MQANRRQFLKTAGFFAASFLRPRFLKAVGAASQVQFSQIVYPGGNWRPRTTALRRLAWALHKRTAVDVALESIEVKPTRTASLATSPLAYLSGDRSFREWGSQSISAVSRYLRFGGTLIVDPAFTKDGDVDGFNQSVDALLMSALPDTERTPVPAAHVIYRSFYQIDRPVGRVEGPASLSAYEIGGRLAVIRTEHDLGGAWARDNLGNWEFTVVPGGDRQRENAFRMGINIVMYALCLNYKEETPHRRFGKRVTEK